MAGGDFWMGTVEILPEGQSVAHCCEMRSVDAPQRVLVPVTEGFCERLGIPLQGSGGQEVNVSGGVPYVGLHVGEDCVHPCIDHVAMDGVGRSWSEGDVRLFDAEVYTVSYVRDYTVAGVPLFGSVRAAGTEVVAANRESAVCDPENPRMSFEETVYEIGPSVLDEEVRVPADDLVVAREVPRPEPPDYALDDGPDDGIDSKPRPSVSGIRF